MKHDTEIVDRATMQRALAGKKPSASGPRARKQPRAIEDTTTTTAAHSEPGQGDRLGALARLAALGFMPRWRAGAGYDFWTTASDRTTTPHATYAAAVECAERELRGR